MCSIILKFYNFLFLYIVNKYVNNTVNKSVNNFLLTDYLFYQQVY